MNLNISTKTRFFALALFFFPVLLSAQTTWSVLVEDNEFTPNNNQIIAGDLVRWVDIQSLGELHDVVSEDGLWTPNAPADGWTFSYRFEEPGTYNYYCSVHREQGMVGTITVAENPNAGGLDFNAGHNGNWWNGLARDGEGVQIELADAGDGELVFVATIYSYGPGGEGGQIFLIAVGTPVGDMVEVDIFITEGGVWGDDYNPDDVAQTQWGTGVFTSTDCELISMVLTPNADYQALGYTVLEYDLVRLTTPLIECPSESTN
ncbi:MAG TPA: plastocyanin/azurin family copper-binding protein [Xanthomonadales bacterium]|nr:plastocyanin/azurin family copper-binding protein [Xanthomonadales bacterium]